MDILVGVMEFIGIIVDPLMPMVRVWSAVRPHSSPLTAANPLHVLCACLRSCQLFACSGLSRYEKHDAGVAAVGLAGQVPIPENHCCLRDSTRMANGMIAC